MRLTNEDVKKFVQENPKLVTCKASTAYPELSVLKYTRKVFYDGNLWNKILENCRGTVVDKDFNPVIMPFEKVYNRGENGTDIPRDEEVVAVRKVNGFMAAATYVKSLDEVLVSTTGSLDSDFVTMAKQYLNSNVLEVIKKKYYERTLLFEICHPSDPHVVEEEHGAYFLGFRRIDWNIHHHGDVPHQMRYDQIAMDLDVMRPQWVKLRFSDLVEKMKTIRHEGFMVHGKTTSLKLKSPFYLTTKLFGRMEHQKLVDNLQNLDKIRERLSEEYYPLIEKLQENIDQFSDMDEQQKFAYIREFLEHGQL